MTGPASRRSFVVGLAALPTLTLPTLAVPATSDIARTCHWAVEHRAWIDATPASIGWTDEQLAAETSRVDAVITRAIEEPSANLRDLHAKATLALQDFELFNAAPGDEIDDGTRIVLTVLREIVAMGAGA